MDQTFNPFQTTGEDYARAPINWKSGDVGQPKASKINQDIDEPFDDSNWEEQSVVVPSEPSLYGEKTQNVVEEGATIYNIREDIF